MDDTNFWGLIAMPVGLVFCFGPPLVVWLKTVLGKPTPDRSERR